MNTIKMLQQFTDRNRQKSLEEFFEALKNMRFQKDGPATYKPRPIEFPAFHPQLPPPLLAKLLDLATESKMYDIGRSLLFSDDWEGPLIHPGLHCDWIVGASIVRFGTMAGENDLVLKIVNQNGTITTDSATHRMSHDLLTALFCSQIKLHRWNSIRGMQEYVLANPGYRLLPEMLSTFAAELLRSSSKPPDSEEDAPPLADNVACHAFTDFLFRWEHLIFHDLSNELHSILAILSTVSTEWKLYCAQFLSFSITQGIKLHVNDFNRILSGIADVYGSSKARETVQMWCYTAPEVLSVYTAPGGLPGMPQYRVDAGQEYRSKPPNIVITHPSGEASLVIKNRMRFNRQTIRIIVDRVKEEEVERRQGEGEGEGLDDVQQRQEQLRETLRWALGFLCRLGADWDDVVGELGEFAELAGVEGLARPSPYPRAAV
ncbi:unnamed protein product [Periconia digitata]|uniref:Uncharacterized protein n=1 Tax=Periconia digitata TaxID=1303443 RepID=A0A9W4XQB4_9PLEO|nr:unnamed protein product [Periconia digitata]